MQVWVDGSYQPLETPAVLATDAGFLRGEAVYEGVRIVARRPLFLDAHLARLADSARALGLEAAWDAGLLRPILGRLMDGLGLADAMARLVLTRGGSEDRGPAGGREGRASALAWVEPVPAASLPDTPPWKLTCHPERVLPFLPGVKHTSRLAHAVARRRARESGFDDALLVHADGSALEGTSSNLFFFEADTLHTPEPGCGILPGITREVVLELAPRLGYKTVEGRYPAAVVAAADECFLTFTSAGVKPVGSLDGDDLPAPVPGSRTRRLSAAYEERCRGALAAEAPL